MTQYSRGKRFEWKVRDLLTADGYIVIQAGGSRGAADLVALKIGQVLLVQVKKTNPLIPRPERVQLVHVAQLCGALPIVAYQPEPRKPVRYRLLTGYEPKQWKPWTPDEYGSVSDTT